MVYWLTTNLWTTGQGIITRRLMPKPDLTAAAAKRSSRTPPKEAPATNAKDGETAASGAKDGAPVVAGPPRRVKKKRSGGGRRR